MTAPRSLVTGAAGFIGSHLVDRLLARGGRVAGVDDFSGTYAGPDPRANLRAAGSSARFELVDADLATAALEPLLDGVDYVFHLAGRPGVRSSWGAGFAACARRNIDATQRLLEAAAAREGLQRFVFASTSSVYGNVPSPMTEAGPTRPASPYGITKRAAEDLCRLYAEQRGVPVVILRYFTVYGPRQRADMAFSRFIAAALAGRPVVLYGDGHLRRDFTFVDDAVEATLLAAVLGTPGRVYNVGSGRPVSLREAVRLLERALGRPVDVKLEPGVPPGDMRETWADIARARRELAWVPRVDLEAGLERQVAWTLGEAAPEGRLPGARGPGLHGAHDRPQR